MALDRVCRAGYALYGTKLRKALRDTQASVRRFKHWRVGSRWVMGRPGSRAMAHKAFCDAFSKLTGKPDKMLPAVNSSDSGVCGRDE